MNNIALIDLDSVCFSIASGNKVLNEFGQPEKVDGKFVYAEKTEEELYQSADFFMNDILTSCEAKRYIAFIKGKGNYRYSINSEYKANRPKQSPSWWFYVKPYLIEKWGAIEVNDIEVDDAINITKNHLKNEAFICAIDKDLLSLEGRHFNWRKKEWVEMDFNQSNLYFWTSMITGDTVDNIKGLPGKGIKFAEKEFKHMSEYKFHTFKLYIEHFGEYEGIKEFYKNYMCLKMLKYNNNFIIPQPVEYKQIEIN